MKAHFLKTRVTTDVFAELCRETALRGCTLSDLVREKIRMADQTIALSKAMARLESRMEYLVRKIDRLSVEQDSDEAEGGNHG